MLDLDYASVNDTLRYASGGDIVRWATSQGVPAIATTSMGRNAAVMLHLLSQEAPSLPVVWVDTGYNLRDTYVVAERLIQDLGLDVHVFSPQMTSERRNAIMGKLEPFDRALAQFRPELWLTGLRQEETEHRKSLDIVSLDHRGIVKVAPLFYWSEDDIEAYMERYELPTCRHYFDPTKVHDGRECGLHTAA